MDAKAHILVLTILVSSALASSGDSSPLFIDCVDLCNTERCQPPQAVVLSWPLQLTQWSCLDDCKYSCMHEITGRDVARGDPIQQYYGKWPFWRFAGMQEPASVAFSLLNLWFHSRGAHKVQEKIPNNHPMKTYYLVWSLLSISAWIWSSVFHTRDLPFTEKLDYFSAALAILYALYYTVIRLFHLYPRYTPPHSPHATSYTRVVWSSLCILAYLAHTSYLTLLPRFDYTYNMVFNLVLGLGHNALWLIYSLPTSLIQRFPSQPKSYRPSFSIKPAVFVVLTTAATALEVFDFPPWGGIIDAHALWHLSTAPITLFWYDFLVEDSLDYGWREQKA